MVTGTNSWIWGSTEVLVVKGGYTSGQLAEYHIPSRWTVFHVVYICIGVCQMYRDNTDLTLLTSWWLGNNGLFHCFYKIIVNLSQMYYVDSLVQYRKLGWIGTAGWIGTPPNWGVWGDLCGAIAPTIYRGRGPQGIFSQSAIANAPGPTWGRRRLI